MVAREGMINDSKLSSPVRTDSALGLLLKDQFCSGPASLKIWLCTALVLWSIGAPEQHPDLQVSSSGFGGGVGGGDRARIIGPFKCTYDLSGFNNNKMLFVSTRAH